MKIFGIVYILGKRNKRKRFCNFSYEVLGDTRNRPNNYGCSPTKETEQMTKISILT